MKKLKLVANIDFAPRMEYTEENFVHNHDFFEVSVVTQGSIKHIYGTESKEVGVGDCILIPPEISHAYEKSDKCAHWNILISDKLFKYACAFLGGDAYAKLSDGIKTAKISYNRILVFNEELKSFLENYSDDYRLTASKVITVELVRLFYDGMNTEAETSHDEFKLKCLQLIQQCFTEPNALNTVRIKLGYTNSYFCKKFRQSFDMTPTDYINDLRLSQSAFLLQSTDSTIEECCFKVGMRSVQFYIKKFKQKYGCTPSAYKKSFKPLKR